MNYAVSRRVNYYDECDKYGKLAMRYFRCERDWLFTACLAIRRARSLSRFVCMNSLLINYYYVNYTIFVLYAYVAYTLK